MYLIIPIINKLRKALMCANKIVVVISNLMWNTFGKDIVLINAAIIASDGLGRIFVNLPP